MQMLPLVSGKLRAAGYDRATRVLQVQFDNGELWQYAGVGEDVWRRLSSASSPWSFFRDNIEEEFAGRRVGRAVGGGGKNPLDDLFGSA